MSDYVDENGELIEAEENASIATLVQRHHFETEQVKVWTAAKAATGARLVELIRDKAYETNGIVARKVESRYPKTDGQMLLQLVTERFGAGTRDYEQAIECLFGAATGFKKSELPTEEQAPEMAPLPELIDRATSWHPKATYVTTSVVKQVMPVKSNA